MASREEVFDALRTGALRSMLLNGASGDHGVRAAIWLLIENGAWLRNEQFVDRWVTITPGHDRAYVDWESLAIAAQAGQISMSHGSDQILLFACALASDTPVRLRRVIGPLDTRNATLVAEAFTRACQVT